jgi:hypothetical protein
VAVPELFVLEFEGFGKEAYDRVNKTLGVDMETGAGDWPPGLISHTAGPTEDGWIVVEVWETREDQEDFMESRLGPALHSAEVTKPPKRAQWSKTAAHHTPRKPSQRRSASAS